MFCVNDNKNPWHSKIKSSNPIKSLKISFVKWYLLQKFKVFMRLWTLWGVLLSFKRLVWTHMEIPYPTWELLWTEWTILLNIRPWNSCRTEFSEFKFIGVKYLSSIVLWLFRIKFQGSRLVSFFFPSIILESGAKIIGIRFVGGFASSPSKYVDWMWYCGSSWIQGRQMNRHIWLGIN